MSERDNDITIFLILSVMMHIGLGAFSYLLPDVPVFNGSTPVEIIYKDNREKDKNVQRQFVVDPNESEKSLVEDLKEKAKLLSRITQRVEKEMNAREQGPVVNRQPLPIPKPQMRQPAPSTSAPVNPYEPPPLTGAGPQIVTKQKTTVTQNIGGQYRSGMSTSNQHIPRVQDGGFTALNTDQFVFYTFYARIREQIYNRWVQNMSNFVSSTPRSEIKRLAQRQQVTQIEVILNADGQFLRAQLHRQSQSTALDEVTVAALRSAAPFINPPSEIVSEDGLIHLHYQFYVSFSPY
jgi:hypothetical protein